MWMRRLDTPRSYPYTARALAVVAVLCVGGGGGAEVVSGVQLPDGAQKVGENRYRAPEDYEGTLKYYKTVYPAAQYPRKPIVNQPGVKAIHIANPSGKGFEGINIYEANDEVRIFIVAVASAPKATSTKKSETKSKQEAKPRKPGKRR